MEILISPPFVIKVFIETYHPNIIECKFFQQCFWCTQFLRSLVLDVTGNCHLTIIDFIYLEIKSEIKFCLSNEAGCARNDRCIGSSHTVSLKIYSITRKKLER